MCQHQIRQCIFPVAEISADNDFIDAFQGFKYRFSLSIIEKWPLPFGFLYVFVRGQYYDKPVSQRPCPFKQPDMAIMENVICSVCHYRPHWFSSVNFLRYLPYSLFPKFSAASPTLSLVIHPLL